MFYLDFKLGVRLRGHFTKCKILPKLKYNIYSPQSLMLHILIVVQKDKSQNKIKL